MAVKLSSRQQAQLAFLETVPPKIARVDRTIEQMSLGQADDVMVRGLTRVLDELKAHAGSLGMGALAETAGIMSTMSRRGGGVQMKVRGLRDLLGSLKVNFDGAMRSATTPEGEAGQDPAT